MNAFEAAAIVARCLDEDSLDYAIGGALALTAWSVPRDTKDVDISVYAGDDELERVFDALERAGVMLNRSDAVREHARIGLFYGYLGNTRVDVFIGGHPHFAATAGRRVRIDVPGADALWFLSVEDLVVFKLLYARAKDVPDLERLFAARPTLDVAYVRGWLDQMVAAGDRRFALLDELTRRFATPAP